MAHCPCGMEIHLHERGGNVAGFVICNVTSICCLDPTGMDAALGASQHSASLHCCRRLLLNHCMVLPGL